MTLSLMSAFGLGLYDVSKKAALHQNAVLPVLLLSTLSGLGLLLIELMLAPLAPALGQFVRLTRLSAADHGLVLLKAIIVSASWVSSFVAIKHLPISLSAPIRASAPIFTVAGALLWFQERPSAFEWAGVVIILCAYLAFSYIGRGEGIVFEKNRFVGFLVLGTFIGAGSSLYDKFLLQHAELPPFVMQFWFTIYSALLQALLLGVWWWPRQRSSAHFHWRWSIALVGGLLVVADQFYFEALATSGALISVVSVLRRTNVVVSFSLGSLLFRERLIGQKALGLAMVLVGVGLLLFKG